LREWSCPQDVDECDADVDIVVNAEGTFYSRTKTWDQVVPTAAAANWNCKYRVSLDKTNTAMVGQDGFLVVQIESYGFEEIVTVMSQPADATAVTSMTDWIGNKDANGVRVY